MDVPLDDPRLRRVFAADVVSMLGTSIALVALVFAVLSISDAAGVGIVLAARTLPELALLLIADVVAPDRLQAANSLRAFRAVGLADRRAGDRGRAGRGGRGRRWRSRWGRWGSPSAACWPSRWAHPPRCSVPDSPWPFASVRAL